MFSPRGPSARELTVQALSSVEHGYDLLAPTFDQTPFRTPDSILDATTGALRPLRPFGRGLDLCCGTGAGLDVLGSVCDGPVTGIDFSAGMLAQASCAHPAATLIRADARTLPFASVFDLAVSFGALGHFLPAERPALLAGVYRALRPGGLLALPAAAPPPVGSFWYWGLLGFDAVMRVRNTVWRPPFVMYYRTCPLSALLGDLAGAGFTATVLPLLEVDGRARCGLVLARKPG